MAVAHADCCHAGKKIQIPLPVHVPQPLHVSLVEKHWLLIGGNLHDHGVAVLCADLHHPLFGHTLNRDKIQTGEKESRYWQGVYLLFSFILSWSKSYRHRGDVGRMLLLPCIPLVWKCMGASLGCLWGGVWADAFWYNAPVKPCNGKFILWGWDNNTFQE